MRKHLTKLHESFYAKKGFFLIPKNMVPILAISSGAILGALLRFWLGSMLNSSFPTIPLGTLIANLLGGFLMGTFMALTRNHTYLSETLRLAIATGFLGSLTTFSTFSGETMTLLMHHEYFWGSLM